MLQLTTRMRVSSLGQGHARYTRHRQLLPFFTKYLLPAATEAQKIRAVSEALLLAPWLLSIPHISLQHSYALSTFKEHFTIIIT